MASANILFRLRPFKCSEIKNISLLSGNLRYTSSKSTTGADTSKPEKVKKESSKPSKTSASPSSATPSTVQSVIYSSVATPKDPSGPVGPGASKTADYKNPEYYCYNELSYFDLELEMMKDRLPQPKSGSEMY
ncbi:NADH dehydrogenase [ubiquinone] flavoprotein 3, mitochondrial [Armadillidium nasatum]|uniref:NADH dehydrogenase [ubiquinone] flavoprotein 3, mitochondrial n=1 Tax=Armadillidium nasatum TaxID=96803 RepID=A0A5N5SQP0_9CRUS|nr:NADH dehydrogenase [ubiquinone] flavoprotein 3, mitochondrial [Armadillidium nasatum]